MLAIGDMAPEFELYNQDNELIRLSDFRGCKMVVYFYPKDDTPGCTREAQDFSLLMDQFDAGQIQVLGISKDSPESHRKFRGKHSLRVTLLSDPDGETLNAYGVWAEKSMYGKSFMGIVRTTFLIDETGRIENIWSKVSVPNHAATVLHACEPGSGAK